MDKLILSHNKNFFGNKRIFDYIKLHLGNVGVYYRLNKGRLDCTVSGYYDLIYDLNKLGYVTIEPTDESAKTVCVSLTESGRELRDHIFDFESL